MDLGCFIAPKPKGSTEALRWGDLGLWPKGAGENTSRRDGAIVAWHEVPGTAPPKRAVP
jgi:hypothetical protein